MPESVIRNAREMHTCVNSFLNSADDGLNLWKRRGNILIESEIRQRRPIIRQGPALDESQSDVEAEDTKKQLEDCASGQMFRLNFVRRTFIVRLCIRDFAGLA